MTPSLPFVTHWRAPSATRVRELQSLQRCAGRRQGRRGRCLADLTWQEQRSSGSSAIGPWGWLTSKAKQCPLGSFFFAEFATAPPSWHWLHHAPPSSLEMDLPPRHVLFHLRCVAHCEVPRPRVLASPQVVTAAQGDLGSTFHLSGEGRRGPCPIFATPRSLALAQP